MSETDDPLEPIEQLGLEKKYKNILIDCMMINQVSSPQAIKICLDAWKKSNSKNKKLNVPFETFWKLYPRKIKRIPARNVWFKLNPDKDLFQIMQNHYTKAYLSTDKQFIPAPDNYLRNERWLDEIITPDTDKKLVLNKLPVTSDSKPTMRTIFDEQNLYD